jgi:hypothetical protein
MVAFSKVARVKGLDIVRWRCVSSIISQTQRPSVSRMIHPAATLPNTNSQLLIHPHFPTTTPLHRIQRNYFASLQQQRNLNNRNTTSKSSNQDWSDLVEMMMEAYPKEDPRPLSSGKINMFLKSLGQKPMTTQEMEGMKKAWQVKFDAAM